MNSALKDSLNLVETEDLEFIFGRRRRTLSQLLPYDPVIKTGERLRDGLKEFLLLLIAVEHSLDFLQKGELKQFDPLVGENACQIRAIKIALISHQHTIDIPSLLEKISHSKARVHHLLLSISNFAAAQNSLEYYLENENLDVEIDSDTVFLIKCYLLSRVKVISPFSLDKPLVMNEKTDSRRIKEISHAGSMFAGNFVKALREKLSQSSVMFVQEMATKLGPLDPSFEMVSEKFSIVHRGLQCIPCYWATRILTKQALNNQIPIVLIAQQKAKDLNYEIRGRTMIFFEPTEKGYQEVERSCLDPNQSALVLFGNTCRNSDEFPTAEDWKRELVKCGPVDLFLAYAAAHRQYPDESKDQLVLEMNSEELNHYKAKAANWGCSLDNPSLFFLAHAYCEKIKNIDHNA